MRLKSIIKRPILFTALFLTFSSAKASCPECGRWKLHERHDGRYAFVEIDKMEKNKLKAYLYLASSSDDLSRQESDFILNMKKNHAEYRNEATGCELLFVFKNKELIISNKRQTNNACGFKDGISADGHYIRKK